MSDSISVTHEAIGHCRVTTDVCSGDSTMCGRFTLHSSVSEIAAFFLAASIDVAFPDEKPRFNIAPSQMIATVRWSHAHRAEFVPMKWGLVPSWAKDPKIGYKMINARSETLAEKPSFRIAMKRRRCLIPADGFYEWRTEGKQKRPFYIHRPKGELFAFAGLWEHWSDASGSIESTTIITTGANRAMQALHDRMPVIIEPHRFREWLTLPESTSSETWNTFFQPVSDDYLAWHEVSMIVNSPRNESPDCIVESNGSLF